MKKLINAVCTLCVSAMVLALASCSGGASGAFGSLPEEVKQYRAEKAELQEKAKEVKNEADKRKLIEESQKMEEKWGTRLEESAKSLDGKEIKIEDGEITVTSPVSLTFDHMAKSSMSPVFLVNGEAKAAENIYPDAPLYSSRYRVYLVGYNAEGVEEMQVRVGYIAAENVDGKGEITAGTPVEFETLMFVAADDINYEAITTYKLIAK